MSVRDFIINKQQNLLPKQTCNIRICDIDEYEHLSFTLRKDTDLDKFNNVYDQDILDAYVGDVTDWNDEEGHTLLIIANIEL